MEGAAQETRELAADMLAAGYPSSFAPYPGDTPEDVARAARFIQDWAAHGNNVCASKADSERLGILDK